MTQSFRHFCPVARAVEKIGDKWSLLIIRDLLSGPQRFTDLIGSLSNITPKWLTRRLRDLEEAGIVQRNNQSGHRAVWYSLTSAGRDLGPVVEALTVWGFRYAMRPPVPGEVVHPDLMMRGLTFSLNKKNRYPAHKITWNLHFPQATYALSYDNESWLSRRGEEDPNADVSVTTTPETWAALMTAPRTERSRLTRNIQITGSPEKVDEFMKIFGILNTENARG
ncbi:MAG: transcriptional regulator [Deltaproteobacteria bacterium]|nr:transcriptional regulator [Deltaproteobacteria bacterium]